MGIMIYRDYKYRFIAKMDHPKCKNGCIKYLGAISKSGYGVFMIDGKSYNAHRISYELFVGKIPNGKSVLHKCDNRQCIAPQHLFLGTQADNVKDMKNKKRNSCGIGEKHGHSKLTIIQVKEIKNFIKLGHKHSIIAKKFNISPQTIADIKAKRSWGYV